MEGKRQLIKKRSAFQPYEEAVKTQKALIELYAKEYKPKHTPEEYYKLILEQEVDAIEERHPQDNNYPDRVFEVFSVVSQHVQGYTKEHCLDQIFDAVQRKKERIAKYKELPSLEELVNSNTKIHWNKEYEYRAEGAPEDVCYSHKGKVILEMRKIGISAWTVQQWDKMPGFREAFIDAFQKILSQ